MLNVIMFYLGVLGIDDIVNELLVEGLEAFSDFMSSRDNKVLGGE